MAHYIALVELTHGQYRYTLTCDGRVRRDKAWIPRKCKSREAAAKWVRKTEGEHVEIEHAG